MQTTGPYDTHPDALATESAQRYFDGFALNLEARQTFGPFPATVVGNRINIERGVCLTIYAQAWVGVGGAGAWRVGLRHYDADDVTPLIDSFDTIVMTPLAAGPGAWFSRELPIPGAPGAGVIRVQVWRVAAVIFEITNTGGLVQALMSARLFLRRGIKTGD